MDISTKEAIRAKQYRVPGSSQPVTIQTTVRADTSALQSDVDALKGQIWNLVDAIQSAASDRAKILDLLRVSGVLSAATNEGGPIDLLNVSKALDDRISSFGVKVEKAA